ncbi:MAG: hypothetical protein K6F17_03885, partial [Lachnospiraceae bacterium]|nr:hypothetical protein [Lachnospiraceae bacterium]
MKKYVYLLILLFILSSCDQKSDKSTSTKTDVANATKDATAVGKEKTSTKSSEKSSEKGSEKSTEKSTEKSSEKGSEKSSENGTSAPTEKSSEKPTESKSSQLVSGSFASYAKESLFSYYILTGKNLYQYDDVDANCLILVSDKIVCHGVANIATGDGIYCIEKGIEGTSILKLYDSSLKLNKTIANSNETITFWYDKDEGKLIFTADGKTLHESLTAQGSLYNPSILMNLGEYGIKAVFGAANEYLGSVYTGLVRCSFEPSNPTMVKETKDIYKTPYTAITNIFVNGEYIYFCERDFKPGTKDGAWYLTAVDKDGNLIRRLKFEYSAGYLDSVNPKSYESVEPEIEVGILDENYIYVKSSDKGLKNLDTTSSN